MNTCSDKDDEHELNSVCKQQCLAGKMINCFKKKFENLFFLGCVCAQNNYYDTNQNRHEPVTCKKESECSCFDERTKEYHKPGAIVKRGQCSTW